MGLFARGLGLVLLAGCAPAHGPAGQPSPVQASVRQDGAPTPAAGPFQTWQLTAGLDCAAALGLHACLRRHEPAAQRRLGVPPRQGDGGLCLPVASAPTCLRDRDGLRYTLLDGAPGHFLVVEAEDTGGFAVLLVDRAEGHTRRIDNRPLFSADGSRFATVSYDTDAGYVPNRVAVWEAGAASPVAVVDGFAPGTGPVAIRWVGPARLQVRYRRAADAPDADDAGTFHVWQDARGNWRDDYDG